MNAKKLKFFSFLFLALNSQLSTRNSHAAGLDWQTSFEYWNLSYFSPSSIYRAGASKRWDAGTLSIEWSRTGRFGYQDNTFAAGWSMKNNDWGWSLQGSATPLADVMYRHNETATLYLPPWLPRVETYAGLSYRRYNESRIGDGFAGALYYLPRGFEVLARGGRSRTALVDSLTPAQWSNSWSLEAGYSPADGARVYAWRAGWKEFVESGLESSGEFKSAENGLGLSCRKHPLALRFSLAYEKRSTASSIHKTSIGLDWKY
ncbi:MAG: hypothetical protein HY547_06450 [Elusimicrobia bacterium]|nr:hypothetical protein [Elusimicrobiota bacterium]